MFILTCIADDKLIFSQLFNTRKKAEQAFIYELVNEENPILNPENEGSKAEAEDYAKSGEYRDDNYSLHISESEPEKDKYMVWNNNDANDSFEVEGESSSSAAVNALSELGWSISADPIKEE
jgi:hypothetical protein